MTEPVPGPKYRTCAGCHTRPADGVVTVERAATQFFVHVCDRCIPDDGVYRSYDGRTIDDEEMELDR